MGSWSGVTMAPSGPEVARAHAAPGVGAIARRRRNSQVAQGVGSLIENSIKSAEQQIAAGDVEKDAFGSDRVLDTDDGSEAHEPSSQRLEGAAIALRLMFGMFDVGMQGACLGQCHSISDSDRDGFGGQGDDDLPVGDGADDQQGSKAGAC